MNLSKKEIRNRIRQKKQKLNPMEIAARSEALCAMVLRSESYRQAKTIYGYLPFNQEVRLLPLLQQALSDGKQVALPKCRGKQMQFILMDDLSNVRPGSIGAPEPIADGPVANDPEALVIVPGIAFDKRGYRVGYGGGYYDRFLAEEPLHPTIALCFDFQLLPCLDPESHDLPVDIVLSI